MKQSPPSPQIVRRLKYAYAFLFLPKFIRNWPIVFLGQAGFIDLSQGKILKLTNGLKFKIKHILDILTILEININNDYHFSPGNTKQIVIDIGANIGTFSILAATQGDQITVHSFEPSKSTFSLLKQNIRLNKLQNQIIPHKFAVYKKNTKLKLYFSGPSGLKNIYQSRNETKYELVQTITLSDIFAKYKIKKCHFLKIDCEGAEYDILASIPKRIFNKIDQISLEFHEMDSSQKHHDLIRILKNHGFKIKHKYHSIENNIGYIEAFKK